MKAKSKNVKTAVIKPIRKGESPSVVCAIKELRKGKTIPFPTRHGIVNISMTDFAKGIIEAVTKLEEFRNNK